MRLSLLARLRNRRSASFRRAPAPHLTPAQDKQADLEQRREEISMLIEDLRGRIPASEPRH